MKNILISGSLAYDSIMVFQDYFKNHILPDQIHKLSVSFFVPELKRNFGGTAGNIAYNLSLLNSNSIIIATAGDDFSAYEKRLSKFDVMQDYIKIIPASLTAQAYITTDLDDNQITAFHPGAMMESHQNSISNITEKIDLAIISPAGKEGMLKHARECFEKGIPFMFDPGQGLPMFNKNELNTFINQATYIAVNDYEAELLMKISGLDVNEIQKKVEALIITKGAYGSEIYSDKKIKINPITADSPIDPTGCGDAYRAGLLYGITNKLTWEETGKLASVMGSIKIKTQGGQNHQPSLEEIEGLFGAKLT
ncbi:MAG: carbohydrate kinase family protein [Nitrosomonadales bacterium]|nr:carbohydrate kinase family protein [Nitrosomonadales bacterium]